MIDGDKITALVHRHVKFIAEGDAIHILGQPQLAAAIVEQVRTDVREVVAPFVACMEYIPDTESDEEWAKFRLLVKNYRALAALSGMTVDEARRIAGFA